MLTGLVSNIQKFSLQDGPGIRTTVFLKGCPLQCAWCHNPENISRQPELAVFEARCIRCGQCIEVCSQQINKPAGPETSFPPGPATQCNLCGACVEACPSGARVLLGKPMTVGQVLAEVLADRTFYEESQGGVTFSGGEPLLQFDFLRALLQACRRQGLHTAMDTCGFAPREVLLDLAGLTDLFLYDLKFIDDGRHREFTGVSNKLILENLQELARIHQAIWLRIPLIPGLNDSPEELQAMARLARSLPAIRQINLLPYHKTGLQKFQRLGRAYRLPDVASPSAECMELAAKEFSALGLPVKVGG